jgi:hypothetical protein
MSCLFFFCKFPLDLQKSNRTNACGYISCKLLTILVLLFLYMISLEYIAIPAGNKFHLLLQTRWILLENLFESMMCSEGLVWGVWPELRIERKNMCLETISKE